MYLNLYRIFSVAAGPLIDLYLARRRKNGKEDPKRFPERLGHAGFPRPDGSLVWFHAASVGEMMSVLPMIQAISDQYKDVHILLTTGTVTSAKLLEDRLPDRVFHQYVPIDKLITVRRFLDHWKPNLALWVESELWPNLIVETHRTRCPMVQINARISASSFEKWKRYRSMAKRLLSCFSLSLVQSEVDKQRLEALGASHCVYVGNLKFDAPALPADPKETGKLVSMIGDRPLWVAASTHPGEEAMAVEVHNKLKERHDKLLTIIIPRHPERVVRIAEELKDKAKITVRSQSDVIGDDTDIYIADTIGEMGIFYRLASIVFMGGSLVQHGGQNPLEPARLECALITGPYTHNFSRIYKELENAEAVVRVANKQELAEKVELLLRDHEYQEKLASIAAELMQSKAGVLSAFMEALEPYLLPLSEKTNSDEDA